MTEAENLVLILLRRMDEKLDRLSAKFDDLVLRTGGIETELAQLHVRFAESSVSSDSFERRMERIEKRLDLVDLPH